MVNEGPDTTDASFKLDFDLFNPLHRSSHTANVHNCRPSQVGSKTIKNMISIKIFLQKQLYLASLSTGGGMVAENMTWGLIGWLVSWLKHKQLVFIFPPFGDTCSSA